MDRSDVWLVLGVGRDGFPILLLATADQKKANEHLAELSAARPDGRFTVTPVLSLDAYQADS